MARLIYQNGVGLPKQGGCIKIIYIEMSETCKSIFAVLEFSRVSNYIPDYNSKIT